MAIELKNMVYDAKKRRIIVVVIACMLLATLVLFLVRDKENIVETNIVGAMMVYEDDNAFFLRAYSPIVQVETHREEVFAIHVDNVNPGSPVEGVPANSDIVRGNRNITLRISEPGSYNIRIGEEAEGFVFYVIGDTHGYPGPLEEMLSAAQHEAVFVLHCGDLTPSSRREQFDSYLGQIGDYPTPVFTTPGNHDARDGMQNYSSTMAPLAYHFKYGNTVFISIPSPYDTINEDDLFFVEDLLSTNMDKRVFLFTHIPPLFGRRTLEGISGNRLHDIVSGHGNTVVFNGHEHRYQKNVLDGVEYYTTGGGGASLYAPRDQGGFNHYLRVEVGDSVVVSVVEVSPPDFHENSMLVVDVGYGNITISLDELTSMPFISGSMSFQNRYGNWRGPWTYTGVGVSQLLEMAGGIQEGMLLEVRAADGFSVIIGYENIYPGAAWLEKQGPLVIAYGEDDLLVPDWSDGPRLIPLPPGGNYSNQDALDTTPPGVEPPSSAGERCIRNVISIRVL